MASVLIRVHLCLSVVTFSFSSLCGLGVSAVNNLSAIGYTIAMEVPPPPTVLDYAITRRSRSRRGPSWGVAICAAAMPLLVYGLQFIVFEFIHGGMPLTPVLYWTVAVMLLGSWIPYACGIVCLRMLRTSCPPPATGGGSVITAISGTAFIVLGGIWCAGCTFFLVVITVKPW